MWKGADKPDPPIVDISVRGWEMKGGVATPAIYTAPTAPQKLFVMVSCQCGVQINNPRALATVHVMVSTYGENEDEEKSIVIWQHHWEIGDVVD